MARRAADRIAEAAERGFAGRAHELSRLRAHVRAEDGPLVVFVRGPGGIGKSRLLQELAPRLAADASVAALDCSAVEPTPAGLLGALARALDAPGEDVEAIGEAMMAGRPRGALLLDHYESFALLDSWLRRELLPALPAGVTTIAALRDRPLPGWRTDPGWADLVAEVELGELAPAAARSLLAARGLDAETAERALRMARGHPLALTLAATALRADGFTPPAEGPPPEVVAELVRRILSGLDGGTVAAAEAAAVVRRVTEPLLAALVDAESARETYGRLRELPFATQTTEGVALHDVARDAIAADLGHRDPERLALLRRRAADHLARGVRGARAGALWGLTADLLFLIDHPLVRDAFFCPGSVEHGVEPAGPPDHEAIAAIATRWERGAERWLHPWLERQAAAFHVVRDRRGRVAAFFAMAEPSRIDAGVAALDPVVARVHEHLDARPLERGERALIVRRGASFELGERPSPELGAAWLDVKRSYLELRPHLRRVYVASTDPGPSAPAFAALGFKPAGDPLPVGAPATHLLALDMGPASVDGWLSGLLGAEPPGVSDSPTSAAGAADGRLEALSGREREVLVLVADGLSNRAVAERLVISPKTAGRHLENIYAKLGVRSRAQAARVAAETGLVQPPKGTGSGMG